MVFGTRFILGRQFCVCVHEFTNMCYFLLILLSFNVSGKPYPWIFKPTTTIDTLQECLTSKSLHTCMHSHNWIPPVFQSNRREALTSGYFYVHAAAIQTLNDSSILMRCFLWRPPPTTTHIHKHTHTYTLNHISFLSEQTNLLSVTRSSLSLDGFICIMPLRSERE